MRVAVAVMGSPRTYSIAKYGRPSAVAPPSKTRRDGWVVHQRQRLAFGIEAGEHLRSVHARLDHLDGDLPPHRLRLLGQPHLTHAAFAQPLQ